LSWLWFRRRAARIEPVAERRSGSGQDLPHWIQLEPGEHVLFHELPDRRARLGAYLATLGLFELWRRRTHFILTNHRLIAVRGVVSRDQQIIPLDKVDQVTLRPRGWSTSIDVATVRGLLGTQPIGPLGQEQAKRLAQAVQDGRRQ
jgi:hypothetical protein